MRVTLMHNPKAGRGKHDKKELMAALAKAGHHATYQSTKKSGYKKALKKPGDVVLVAGGDGTIAKIARQLLDSGIPLSVLPLGTANNVARTLGFVASSEEIIARLEGGKQRAFDVALARGPWGKRCFFEAAGGGLLADYVRVAKGKDRGSKKISKEQEMMRHVSILRRLLHDYSTRKWKISIDGENISDRYIFWEVMNIRSVGPALDLAPRARTKDGQFDFVCARETDRSVFMDHLDARLAGKKSKSPLPTRKLRKLVILWNGSTLHFDDKLWPRKMKQESGPNEIEITVRPSALIILEPAATTHGLTHAARSR